MIQTIKLIPGKAYTIIKDGATIDWEKSIGPYSWECMTKKLKIGDIITYLGTKMGLGSDNIRQDNFSCDGQSGAFWPQDWGSADTSFMKEEFK